MNWGHLLDFLFPYRKILQRLNQIESKLMSAISDYTTAVNAKLDEIDTEVSVLTAGITGVSQDVAFLKDAIEKLQTNPQDQALLDASIARVNSLSDKLKPLSDSIAALDAATDSTPTPPPAP